MKAIAYHEAGHACVIHALGHAVVSIEVSARAGFCDWARTTNVSRVFQAAIALAGPEAEREFIHGFYHPQHSRGDFAKVKALGLTIDEDLFAGRIAHEIVARNSTAIHELADLLLKRGRLDDVEFEAAVGGMILSYRGGL